MSNFNYNEVNTVTAKKKTTAERAKHTMRMADLDRDEAYRQAEAMVKTRDALRVALTEANISNVFAFQDQRDVTIGDAEGVYGLIHRALEIMGEDVERWVECGEWE